MPSRHSRRRFLQTSSIAASALAFPAVLRSAAERNRLRVAIIGCGGQGVGSHVSNTVKQSKYAQLVAVVDANEKRFAEVEKGAKKIDPAFDMSTVKTFTDYRKLYETAADTFDAIIVATPNHHHALPALLGMKAGKHCYVEKPLAQTLFECNQLAEWAAKYKVATQMGNQGHSDEGYRRLCEYIWAGAIGTVKEVHSWTDRANGGSGGRLPAKPVPAGLNWESWVGPAPYREFHDALVPHTWHTWRDFGNGSIGNMACHIMDGAFWALNLTGPCSIAIEDMAGGSDERYPFSTRLCYSFPQQGDRPPVKLYWYDGIVPGTQTDDTVKGLAAGKRNVPPIRAELEKKFDRKFGGDGSIYVGDKGMMYTGCYGENVRIIPEEAHQKYGKAPEQKIPRVTGGHHVNFFSSALEGKPPVSEFGYASKLTTLVLLGSLVSRLGKGKTAEWDGSKFTNAPELNQWLKRENRKGWEA
jgi:predicted dehydrogenase